MASTRNNNMPAEYCNQQQENNLASNYTLYKNSSSGQSYSPAMSTFGVYSSRMPASNFSNNYIDIETQLFGIGSTNLVKPKTEVNPDFKRLSEKYYEKVN